MSDAEEGKKSEEKKSESSKWWEVYAVRYFVGTVIGGIVVFILNSQPDSPFKGAVDAKSSTELSAQFVSVLGALGLAICYISSAPILVFHAARGVFMKRDSKRFEQVLVATFVLVGIIAAGVMWCCGSALRQLFAVELLALLLVVQLVPLVFALRLNGDDVYAYYSRLARARVNVKPEVKQHIESYRHLREHGNALFIVMFEALFGFIIWLYPVPAIALIAAVTWIVPAGFVWFIGTMLESRFAIEYEK